MRAVINGFWPFTAPNLNLLQQVVGGDCLIRGRKTHGKHVCPCPICSPGVDNPQMKAAIAGTDAASGSPGSIDPAQWPAAVSAKNAVIRGREARFVDWKRHLCAMHGALGSLAGHSCTCRCKHLSVRHAYDSARSPGKIRRDVTCCGTAPRSPAVLHNSTGTRLRWLKAYPDSIFG